jgi:signal transduction histidine kinase
MSTVPGRQTGALSLVAEVTAANDRLITALASLSDGILMVNGENRVELFNPRYVEIFSEAAGGADLSEVVVEGRSFFDMIREGYNLGMFKPHPDGVDAWIANRKQAWETPASQWELELRNGTWILLNERGLPDGGRISIYTDVTDLKRREAETESARQRFQEAIEAINSGFALWDAEDRLVIANTRYSTYFSELADLVVPGNAFDEIVREGIKRGMFPLANGNVDRYLAEIEQKRRNAKGEIREQLINGYWLQITDNRTKDGGIVSVYSDITERKQAEVGLKAALEEFNAISEHIDYGILFTGPDLRTRIVNRAFRDLWDMDQEFIDRHPTMREVIEFNRYTGLYSVPDDEFDAWMERRLSSIGAGDVPPTEIIRGDGKVLSYQVVSLPDGGRMLTYFDITELKVRETETARARDLAEAALADLKKAQERLIQTEKMASLGQLTAGIAHEIKNPLNFVNNFAKLSAEMLEELEEILEEPIKVLEEEYRNDAQDLLNTVRENLGKINEHGRRADSIVKNMLSHSREGPSHRQSSDVNAIADEALKFAYHGARAEDSSFNITMETEFDPHVGKIACYPQQLLRVFVNLTTNGIYAATKRRESADEGFEPKISLTTRLNGEMIEVIVRDNGTGMPEDVKDKIFLPFFTTKPAGEGTGLGLSLSYDTVVKQHGGTLTVESKPDQYTVFTVSIPRTSSEE